MVALQDDASSGTVSKRRTGLAMGCLLFLALILRLPGFTESLWLDELFTSNLKVGGTVQLLNTIYGDIHPPAYFVFMSFWNAVFGDSEVSIRLPPLMCGLASIALVCLLGEMFLNRATGLVAGFLMAVSPVHIWYSQEARPYSASLFLLLLAMYAFYRLQGSRSRNWSLVYAASLLGVVFTHYYMATFLFVFGVLALLMGGPNRTRIISINLLVLVLLGIYVGAKVYFSELQTSRPYLRTFDLYEAWMLFFNWFLCGNSLTPRGVETMAWPLWVLQGAALMVCARGVLRLVRRGRNPLAPGPHVMLHCAVLPAFLFVLPLFGMDQTYIERSVLPALPFFLLLVAAGLTGVRRRWTSVTVGGLTAAACGMILFSFFHYRGHWTVYKPNPDWRQTALYLGAEMASHDEIRSLYSFHPSPTALSYYDRRIQEVKYFIRDEDKIERVLTDLTAVFGDEGFPGAAVNEIVRDLYGEFSEYHASNSAGTRLRVFSPPDRRGPGDSGEPQIFYLLCWPQDVTGNPDVIEILESPRYKVVESRFVRMLAFFKLQRIE